MRRLTLLLWFLLLLLPSLTVFSSVHAWDVSAAPLVAVSASFFGLLLAVLGARCFMVITYPLAFLGIAAVAADFLRNFNLLEFAYVASDSREAWESARPYAVPLLIAAAALAAPLLFRMNGVLSNRRALGITSALMLATALMLSGSPSRAWPLNIAAFASVKATGNYALAAAMMPYAMINPRTGASWSAKRDPVSGQETYVLILGESVRADRLKPCGGPRDVLLSSNAMIFCDVSSASSSTHLSVPHILGRDPIGGAYRVAADSTVMRAFQDVGFKTFFLSVQEESIAWPDAQVVKFYPNKQTDTLSLMEPLNLAIKHDGEKKFIVLHTYNAHFSYCERYETGAFEADCKRASGTPTRSDREHHLAAYDNAVAESLAFVDAIAARLDQLPGKAFMLYVSDHGENIADDDRELFQHALQVVTKWDTTVPMIVWANERWAASYPDRYATLASNTNSKVMHSDVTPTLMGAAGIAYQEERSHVADLTRTGPPARTRWVMPRLSAKVDHEDL